MTFPALLGDVAAAGGGTPLEYGDDLVTFIDLENGITTSGGNVTEIVGQASEDATYTVPSGHIGPEFEDPSQNDLPGMSHQDDPSTPGGNRLRRKLSSSASALDDIWFGSGTKSVGFAGRWDQASDGLGFNLASVLFDKGFHFDRGWVLRIKSDGTLEFRHEMTSGSDFVIAASGFYSVGDLVLGTLTYDGGNASNSASFRLYNNNTSAFVTTGTVTTSSGSTKTSDASDELVIGNNLDPGNTNINSPFEGSIFALWVTKPARTSIDESYLARWIP